MNYYIKSKKTEVYNIFIRIFGVCLFIVLVWNMGWIITHLNKATYFEEFFSYLFFSATMLISLYSMIMVINSWNFETIKPLKLTRKIIPRVAVIIPTCGEPIQIILNTLRSVIGQNWPKDKRIILVSDDAQNSNLRSAIIKFNLENNESNIIYFSPPVKGHPLRKGDAKAGNLNSALVKIKSEYPDIQFIETRDSDDLVGDKDFLSYCVGHLVRNPEVSFVQTIKECLTHPDDPFSNNEPVFYQSTMYSRAGMNSVFPCGSGLVWRLSALNKIGGFPSWNLVEDLQSGFEILRKGGISAYLPIVGAVGQIAPEDIVNFYKQRGTWALDSLRLLFWRNPLLVNGLNIWQRLQFFELGLSYLLSFSIAIYIISLVINLLFGIYPIIDTTLNFIVHFAIYAGLLELFSIAKSRGISYSAQSRSRQVWHGLMPVFIKATFIALWYGPFNKPSYKVTRKYHEVAWYWKETFIQKMVVISLSFSVAYAILIQHNFYTNLVSVFWSMFFIYAFLQVVLNSWHGVDLKKVFAKPFRIIFDQIT